MPELAETRIKCTVVLNGVTISVEKGGVKIAKRTVTWLSVIRQSNVAASKIDAGVVTRNNNERVFPAMAMMRLTSIGKIKDHRIVEHCAITLGYALESFDDAINERHVMRARELANSLRIEAANTLTVTDIVHIDLLPLDARNTRVTVPEFVNGKGHDISKACNQCP